MGTIIFVVSILVLMAAGLVVLYFLDKLKNKDITEVLKKVKLEKLKGEK